MNPDTKEFEEIGKQYATLEDLYEERPETRNWKKFKIGERIEVKGAFGTEWFTIRKITKKDLILRPMRSSTTSTGTPE